MRGQAGGEIPERDQQAMARFLVRQIQGMRVIGKTGASEADMLALVDNTMGALEA